MNITCVVGARPQFIKLAPFFTRCEELNHKVRNIHTGQHYDKNMSDIFFDELGLKKPDKNLEIGSASQTKQIAKIILGLEEDLKKNKPDWVVVFGDTTSTIAASIVASKMNIKLAHIEAGLRSFNRDMPEEINRIVSDHISDLLFVPSDNGMTNLMNEGLKDKAIRTGDLMADVLFHFKEKISDAVLERYNIKKNDYYLLTLHRPASVDEPKMLDWMMKEILSLNKKIIFPVHPRTRLALERTKFEDNKMVLIPPQSYLDFQSLISNSKGILTDSGGIQKEAYLWKKPCYTLRTETEWRETIKAGWNTLVTPGKDCLLEIVNEWKKPNEHPDLYGDGKAAEKIIQELEKRN
ncbi:MAG: non-hydrolyzing UDP-N-acetylglucosamine 2-epimerase [Candidatus Poseidoniales archaeon]